MGADEDSYCYHYDALGSTDRVTGGDEGVMNQYLYRAFGEQMDVITEGISNRFTWVGRLGYYREPDLDTYWLRARVYEPQRGRFVSRDPVREVNLYRWPGNSPVVVADPGGQQWWKFGGGGDQGKGGQGTGAKKGKGSKGYKEPELPSPHEPHAGHMKEPPPVSPGMFGRGHPCRPKKTSEGLTVAGEYTVDLGNLAGVAPFRHLPVRNPRCWETEKDDPKRPGVCCWLDNWKVYTDALARKCKHCGTCCSKEVSAPASERDYSPLAGGDRCMNACIRGKKNQWGCVSDINAREEYKDATRRCIQARANQ